MEISRPHSERKISLNIISTCRQLSFEILPYIYPKEILTFKLSPKYDQKSWITVTSSLGVKWVPESARHAESFGFRHLPYHELDGIAIEIPAPDPADPGQLVCLWMKARELVELLLSETGRLPSVAINLTDTKRHHWARHHWATDDKLQCSIEDDVYNDYEFILLEFTRLRKCNLTLHVPDGIKNHGSWYSFFKTVIGMDQVFGTYVADADCVMWGDARTAAELEENFLNLHFVLDSLPGRTAAMLRLARFADWYEPSGEFGGASRYLDELERIMASDLGDEGELSMFEHKVALIKWRYRLMVAFNPCSARMQKAMRREKMWYGYTLTGKQVLRRCEHYGCYMSTWTKEHWNRYWFSAYDELGLEHSKAVDREERVKENVAQKTAREQHAKECFSGIPAQLEEDNVQDEDGWKREAWFKFYPEGIPKLDEKLFRFETEMGHLWSGDSPTAPRKRFEGWDEAELYWERAKIAEHFKSAKDSKAMSKR